MTTKKTVVRRAGVAPRKPAAKKTAPKMAKAASKETSIAVVKPVTTKKPKKEHRKKVVRDSFTMPHDEYQKIAEIKAVCLKSKMHVKKSEVLRAGLRMLAGLNATQLKQTMASLEKIKTGRPKKH